MLRFRIDATAVATATVVLIVPAALAEPLVFAPWGGPQHSAFHQLTPERDAVAAPDKTNPVPARLKRPTANCDAQVTGHRGIYHLKARHCFWPVTFCTSDWCPGRP